MIVDILNIPLILVIQIIRKMRPRIFARMRITCHSIDSLVEKNRYKFGCRLVNHSFWIYIGKNPFSEDDEALKVTYFVKKCKFSWNMPKPCDELENETNWLIIDPYSQLSGFQFLAVAVHSDNWKPLEPENVAFIVENEIVPLFQKLRLCCIWFHLSNLLSDQVPLSMFSAIEFADLNLNMLQPFLGDNLLLWPIRHIRRLVVSLLDQEPLQFCDIVRRLSSATVEFSTDKALLDFVLELAKTTSSDRIGLIKSYLKDVDSIYKRYQRNEKIFEFRILFYVSETPDSETEACICYKINNGDRPVFVIHQKDKPVEFIYAYKNECTRILIYCIFLRKFFKIEPQRYPVYFTYISRENDEEALEFLAHFYEQWVKAGKRKKFLERPRKLPREQNQKHCPSCAHLEYIVNMMK